MTTLQQLFAATEDEINLVVGSAALPVIEKLTRKRAAIDMLINSKSDELHRSNEIANVFYGSSPLNRNPVDFVNAFFPRIRSKSPDEVFKAWIESYSAAHGVTLLTATIRILNEQAASLDAEIEVARAQQAIAEAEARRHAEEKAQLAAQAKAEARRHAEEQAHLAAQAEARRRTEEQARLAAQAEAEARRHAEEQAQLAAQAKAEAQRLAVEQERAASEEQKPSHESNGLEADASAVANIYHIRGSIGVTQPSLVTASGAIALVETAALTLQAAIRAAIATLTTTVSSVAAGLFVGVSALIYSPRLADGELPEDYFFSLPLSEMAPEERQDLHTVAADGGAVELPFRISSKPHEEGNSELIVIHATASSLPTLVKVVAATYHQETNTYSLTTADSPPRTLIWTPAETPENSSTTLPTEEPAPSIILGPSITPAEGRIETYPQVADTTFNDLIIVFPIDSGLSPIYVMFKDRREEPGTVTGNGEQAGERWLSGASTGEGVAIPSHIADQLRGQEFRNFRHFREALWRAVGNDPQMAKQFTKQNMGHLLKGKAPYSRRADRVGGRVKLEIHHRIHLAAGGQLYDIGNLRIVTSKLHISIHKQGKDYDQ
ncbi:S-type pyocin domain-containing protein [Pseudomonas huanghezhanensis]|uniref:S-type pyocin domain-containing protein n=1 Tax=Pseudomonas huanghezhanensis TaxID=3002903 RepID=UPI002285CF9F|nr:S-type pyocin domain-containing protein [Pseudomonas sp. BSw22131]